METDILTFEMLFAITTSFLTAGATFGALRFQIIQNSSDIKKQTEFVNRLYAQLDNAMSKLEINTADIRQLKDLFAEEKENVKNLNLTVQDLRLIVQELKTLVNGLKQ